MSGKLIKIALCHLNPRHARYKHLFSGNSFGKPKDRHPGILCQMVRKSLEKWLLQSCKPV